MAISSKDEEEMTAIKRVSRRAIAPGLPWSATAENDADNPNENWGEVILFGKVGYA